MPTSSGFMISYVLRLLEHAVLVDARLVRERVLADDGLVPLHLVAGNERELPAGRAEQPRVDAGREAVKVLAGAERHHHLFEGGVAGPLADAVDGALHLPRAFAQRPRGCSRPPDPGRCGSGPTARTCRSRGRAASGGG